jgi:hypothetical protein
VAYRGGTFPEGHRCCCPLPPRAIFAAPLFPDKFASFWCPLTPAPQFCFQKFLTSKQNYFLYFETVCRVKWLVRFSFLLIFTNFKKNAMQRNFPGKFYTVVLNFRDLCAFNNIMKLRSEKVSCPTRSLKCKKICVFFSIRQCQRNH